MIFLLKLEHYWESRKVLKKSNFETLSKPQKFKITSIWGKRRSELRKREENKEDTELINFHCRMK